MSDKYNLVTTISHSLLRKEFEARPNENTIVFGPRGVVTVAVRHYAF
jgi:hypothetical protein